MILYVLGFVVLLFYSGTLGSTFPDKPLNERLHCLAKIAVVAFFIAVLAFIATGCNIAAHVAARPIINGTPVSVGVEVGR